MRKYNKFLKTMVDTDEQLFNVIEYWSETSTSEEQQEAVMSDLKEGTYRP